MRDVSMDVAKALAVAPNIGGDIVRASWRRCLQDYGLDRANRRPIERVGSSVIRDLRERMETYEKLFRELKGDYHRWLAKRL